MWGEPGNEVSLQSLWSYLPKWCYLTLVWNVGGWGVQLTLKPHQILLVLCACLCSRNTGAANSFIVVNYYDTCILTVVEYIHFLQLVKIICLTCALSSHSPISMVWCVYVSSLFTSAQNGGCCHFQVPSLSVIDCPRCLAGEPVSVTC